MTEKISIGILISRTGSNMNAIVNACQAGYVSADVAFVGSDNPDAKGLVWAQEQGIATFVVDYQQIREEYKNMQRSYIGEKFEVDRMLQKSTFVHHRFNGDRVRQWNHLRWKLVAEKQIIKQIVKYGIDLLILAGFMQTCTSYLIDRVNKSDDDPRIMNIHPALSPAHPGTDGYGDTFRYGCKVGGCTVHFVDYGEDSGPIIGQRGFPILEGWDLDTLKGFGLTQEWELYPYCIQLFAQGRLKVTKNENGRKIVKILTKRRWSDE